MEIKMDVEDNSAIDASVATPNTKVDRERRYQQETGTEPPPVTIVSPEAIRFKIPTQPTYSAIQSVFSILSLLGMAVLSTIMFSQIINPAGSEGIFGFIPPMPAGAELAAWVWLPFLFTIIGSTIGFLFELELLVTGHPFQQTRTKLDTFIRNIRLLNLGPVVATIFFFICSMTIVAPDMRVALLYMAGAAGFGLAFALFFGGAEAFVAAALAGTQLAQIALVLTASAIPGGNLVAGLLIGQAVLQLTSLLIGTATPLKSTAFHVISTVSGVLLYLAIYKVTEVNPLFSMDVAVALPAGSLILWGFIASCVAGLLAMGWFFPNVYGNFRAVLSNAIWSPLYFLLVSADRFPKPFNLSQVYNNNQPKKTNLKPYYQVHPEFLVQSLSIPAAEKLEGNVTIFKKLVAKARKTFSVIALLDHFFPQANIKIPLVDKKRMEIWSDGSNYWPAIFSKEIFGMTLPDGGKMDKTPEPAINAFKSGQLLAYLAESGVASPFLKAAPQRGEGASMMDFRFLESYETKADYEPYGGVAYFKINNDKQCLQLVSVVAPHTNEEVMADPNDSTFRRAESLILASMYYQVISGKHLAEIHMTYNLVEVAMHNAFDVQGQWTHPFRTFLYIHFFSHELAEEITTEHLVQEGAVFSQIFATTHNSLISHLNDCYNRFEYGEDENFEERAALMRMYKGAGEGEILPNACIKWELEYAEIWQRYTTSLIDTIYATDNAVQEDRYLQAFHEGLLTVLRNGLPLRYEGFKTKAGVARFASDTIHHCVVRHQVYGTTGIRAALDPRISKVQVPCDTGTYAVDEWRSLAFVALATGKARFTLLDNDFTYLLDGVDESYRDPMKAAFNQLQHDLKALDAQWNASESDRQWSYDYFRAVPSVLHTGPGY